MKKKLVLIVLLGFFVSGTYNLYAQENNKSTTEAEKNQKLLGI